jgi:CspA family cold shock protein
LALAFVTLGQPALPERIKIKMATDLGMLFFVHSFASNYSFSIQFLLMKTGKVKFFNDSKGFGFIVDDESQKDIFVHISEVQNGQTLYQEDSVSYDVQMGKKGLNAVNVKKV